jgi:Domain of unknown function (DUF6378)
MEIKMDHRDILTGAATVLNNRSQQYGDEYACFDRIAKLASIIINKELTSYDIAMILHATKLGRLQEDRDNPDHYIDGINYMAFGGQFSTKTNIEDDIARMAAKFAPQRVVQQPTDVEQQ